VKSAFRNNLSEFSGALGDLGTFLPLAVSLIAVCKLNATSVFLSAGLLYIAAGLYFRLPVPVQPLKATSAIAVAVGAAPSDIAATALLMGAIFVLIHALRLDRPLMKLFPRSVVRGIQLGLGVVLVKGGWKLFAGDLGGPSFALGGIRVPVVLIGGFAAAGLILLSRGESRFPSALAAILLGTLCGLWRADPEALSSLTAGFVPIEFSNPAAADLQTVLFVLLLPQVPLTFANSVVATADTCRAYFGKEAERVTERNLSASLGIANLASALFGGIPMCHGSGGVTAHYRFGARTGRAGLFIGSLFLFLGILYGKSVAALCALVPSPVLGMLLVYVGAKHAMLARDIARSPRELGVALFIGLSTLATGNLSFAFGGGILLSLLLRTNAPVEREELLHGSGRY
jgi:SulP family sulfate permease